MCHSLEFLLWIQVLDVLRERLVEFVLSGLLSQLGGKVAQLVLARPIQIAHISLIHLRLVNNTICLQVSSIVVFKASLNLFMYHWSVLNRISVWLSWLRRWLCCLICE